MKTSAIWHELGLQFPGKFRFLKKGHFWVLINEEAYVVAEHFHFKLTKLDSEHIQMGFPIESTGYWKKKFIEKKIAFVFVSRSVDDEGNRTQVIEATGEGGYISELQRIDLEAYSLAQERILCLARAGLEEKPVQNFLLKEKLESIHVDLLKLFLRLPKEERKFLREAIEGGMIAMLSDVYEFMYRLSERKILIRKIFDRGLIVREYTKHMYRIGMIRNDTVYLDFQSRFVEVFKICKGIENRL